MRKYSAPTITNFGSIEEVTQNQGDQSLNDTFTLSNIPGGVPNIVSNTQGSVNVIIDVQNP